ncbi:MAG TPA: hypothetical protein VK357_07420 [Rubrobacteraceae bacterium]|nr:hypothetical protein [Rubrobacteraceae bacterium]
MGRGLVGVYPLALADLLEEVVQLEELGAVWRLPAEMLGQPLRELGGEVEPFAPGEVLPERRQGCLCRLFRFGERASPARCWTRSTNSWYCTRSPSLAYARLTGVLSYPPRSSTKRRQHHGVRLRRAQ